MVEESAKPRLGRGLAALLGDVGGEVDAEQRHRAHRRVPIDLLRPNPQNPRRSFDTVELDELADSIRERNIIQPILVRNVPGLVDVFEIVAGERRWRAAQRAGLHDVPIVLISADDREALELAIIENVQRVDLNPIEEALGYERLIAQFGYTQSDLARIVGKSRSHIANMLRLPRLSAAVQEKLRLGTLSAGHARALLSVPNPDSVAERIVAQGLSVRDVERIAQRDAKAEAKSPKPEKDPDTRALEGRLSDLLGLHVTIAHRGARGGTIQIRYQSLEQLEHFSRRLAHTGPIL